MRHLLTIFLALLLLTAAAPAEASSPARAQKFMIATANPMATEAGLKILRAGGSAVDAAIAAQMVLALVEPQSSGIGGGAFLVHFNRQQGATTSYDGRETAPAAATPDRFMGPDGKPLSYFDAVVGGRSVGVPGTLRVLELAHRNHGVLPWARLFEDAIRLAEEGFPVPPRMADALTREKHLIQEAARAYFHKPDGTLWAAGESLRNPALADTLRRVAEGGPEAFYTGPIAQDIVDAITQAPRNPGDMTLADLAGYEAKERPAVCGPYRQFEVCGMGPPSSGALTMLMSLAMLERFDLPGQTPLSVDAAHWILEAQRLAYADRGLYMADSDFVDVPMEGLLDRGYLAGRAALIDPARSTGAAAQPGEVPRKRTQDFAPDSALELPATSHLAIVDGEGNALSMTTTIEAVFGSRLMVRGFLLNNELTDFSFRPDIDGKPVANRVEPGKRSRSSMSPTLVFDGDDKLRLVVGSPGGSQIINYVMKTVIGVLDWGLDPQAAIALPNISNRNGASEIERRADADALAEALAARGHRIDRGSLVSGLQAIQILPDGTLLGGADPRRDSLAAGD
ncbi:MAG: gamma-glutamyltransferase [Alphaproteobacteria bacterium]|nr:gamma-glutamyltransferase [Alphaproteobacteria bacterium]MBU0798350.1 gamma-glutamyltransferase [Alphaproteobacteria bacterium]MBU0887451.1 gamma-glutamyltransferase [Alphaproteobacteria bacterium]MBU1813340.1 gamma-glutamyltransferase [Alphaproteobacteria bacterium]